MPEKDIEELEENKLDSFYEIVSNPGFDTEAYVSYVQSVIPYIKSQTD